MTDLSSTPVAYSGHAASCAQNSPSCRLDKPIITPEQMGKQQKTNLNGGDIMQKLSVLLFTVFFRLGLSACAPEVVPRNGATNSTKNRKAIGRPMKQPIFLNIVFSRG